MSTPGPLSKEEIAARLEKARSELQELEKSFKKEDVEIDERVLLEFRRALDNVRQSAWMVQQWLDMKSQQRDVSSLLSVTALGRVRRATQVSEDLVNELETTQGLVDSGAVRDLFRAVEKLHLRLARLFEQSES